MKSLDFTPLSLVAAGLRRRASRRYVRWTVLLLVSMATWAAWWEGRVLAVERRFGALQEVCSTQAPMVESASVLQGVLEHERTKGALRDLLMGGARMHQVLAELSGRLPTSTYLNELRIDQHPRLEPDARPGAPRTERERADEGRPNVRLVGYARDRGDIGRLVESLSDSGVFEDVSLDFVRPEQFLDQSVQRFAIRCRLPAFR